MPASQGPSRTKDVVVRRVDADSITSSRSNPVAPSLDPAMQVSRDALRRVHSSHVIPSRKFHLQEHEDSLTIRADETMLSPSAEMMNISTQLIRSVPKSFLQLIRQRAFGFVAECIRNRMGRNNIWQRQDQWSQLGERPMALGLPDDVSRHIARIERLQSDAIALRVTIEEKQKELRHCFDAIHQCDANVMKLHYESVQGGLSPDLQLLTNAVDAASEARNSCGPIEDELEHLSIELARTELLLLEKSREYATLVSRYDISPSQYAPSTPSESDQSALGVSEYSDLPLYEDVIYSPSEIEAVNLGYQVDQDNTNHSVDKDYSEHYPDIEANLQAANPPFMTAEPHSASDSLSLIPKPATLSNVLPEPKLPVLQWMPDRRGRRATFDEDSYQNLGSNLLHIGRGEDLALLTEYPAPSITKEDLVYFDNGPSLQDQRSTRGRINRWLLHRLKSSTTEKMLFLSMLPHGVYPPSIKSTDFLILWDED